MMRSTGQTDHVVVIGGGISGLSSAFYLQRQAAQAGKALRVTIVEAEERPGGKINTLHKDGFVIEKGPDSFLARKLPMLHLAQELGLEGELVATNPAAKKTYILHKDRLHPMPQGLVLGVPTELLPFARTGLLSPAGKLRALMDLLLPARGGTEDESIGHFLTRRVGAEVTARIAEPLLAGIYAGELDKLSLRATFPQFREAERRAGSLIRGMRRSRKAAVQTTGAQALVAPQAGSQPTAANAASAQTAAPQQTVHQPAELPPLAAKSLFLTFRGGLSSLVDALTAALSQAHWRLGTAATSLKRVEQTDGEDEQTGRAYVVELADGKRLHADAVIVTTQAQQAAALLDTHMNSSPLRDMHYVSVANVVLAYDSSAFSRAFDGSGFVVPRSEGRTITACTWTSTKWLHTSPKHKALLRCYVGRSGDEAAALQLNDAELTEAVRNDLRDILGLTAVPEFVEITRLPRSMPQYTVGHVERMAAFREELARVLPGVWVTGAAFDGVGLPDCIRQGREAATAVLQALNKEAEARS